MSTLIDGIDITNLLRARDTFERFRIDMQDDRDKAGAILAFEFCFELAWKTTKRVLSARGVNIGSPRDCFRQAALNGLIHDPEQWFVFLDKRNMTVHTYNPDTVDDILEVFDDFAVCLNQLIDNIVQSK